VKGSYDLTQSFEYFRLRMNALRPIVLEILRNFDFIPPFYNRTLVPQNV